MTSQELHDDSSYEQVLELDHKDMIPFIQEELETPHPLIRQFVRFNWLFTLGVLVFAGWQLYHGVLAPGPMILHFGLGVVLSMTLVILLHEGLHGLAYLLVGARSIRFGGSFRKMYFYAVADQFVLSERGFRLVALTPFALILGASLLALIEVPPIFQWVLLGMVVVHNWNCVGDFVLLGFLARFHDSTMYTYDDVEAGKSFFFRKKKEQR